MTEQEQHYSDVIDMLYIARDRAGSTNEIVKVNMAINLILDVIEDRYDGSVAVETMQ